MSDDKKNNTDELVVQAGYVTVLTQVGAGKAYKDFYRGETLPGDVSDEDRERFLASSAVGKRDGDGEFVAAARPVPGEVEPDEIDTDVIPGGSVEQIMAWVGDDLARARVARHEETAKGDKARATLLAELDKVKAAQETEPPAVPEYYDENIAPAPAGGVAAPTAEDASVDDGKTADEKPAARARRRA